ncbi:MULTISPECIES: NADP(H)-dependent aldo-keto reductase [unclassified Pseudomonas]|uniref:NADP(H)-dependent aldo-keto reductase n=1 Tax=unclassified Pseudomonas TaxID=196821 RepID=UPI0024478E6B|nr:MULTISPECIES: NADP(H)-dependent aldo-keto reductase [unclassified Pseudomonas]MDG9927270.1 NADP(H)-dependent aldo-keto reductase [Pseudomonas sp. GD04042]MDH0482339.1 NADP(H)-dependent aldo-keto reductase [Pseudomonas sp. GD04015]MDH0602692.1 NADP(H)-dependent aldo-keto reductase [Pseudomonas sp. GD03869]
MKYRPLGNSDIRVSAIGLGSMTWGHQNSEADAHQQLDYALSQGVNLVDTAEMYPTPTRGETWGSTERFIGSWLARTKRRQDIVLASKIVGPPRFPSQNHIREGKSRHDAKNLRLALLGSLDRLQTDYLDLYQLHWPDRSTNFFGLRDYPWVENEESVAIEETLSALADLVQEGLIRHIGVSNETPWGVARFLQAAERLGLPRIVSIQNPYSLLNRQYEGGLAEFSHREGVGLLAYSPLAFGVLTGKYLDGAQPEGARLSAGSPYGRFGRYASEEAGRAVRAYVELARSRGLSPAQLALAFVLDRPFVTSALIGATSLAQLEENLGSLELALDDGLVEAIDAIHARLPNPSP